LIGSGLLVYNKRQHFNKQAQPNFTKGLYFNQNALLLYNKRQHFNKQAQPNFTKGLYFNQSA
jgi:hypothetical protein